MIRLTLDDRGQRAERLVAEVAGLARERDRGDLAGRLEDEPRRSPSQATVVVAGETKRGKSSFVNALLGRADLSPVDDRASTSTHIVVRHADRPTARVFRDDHDPEEVAVGELAQWVTDAGNPGNRKRVRMVEVGLDHPLLARGLAVVDTPGLGGLDAAHARLTLAALELADALVFVTDAEAPLGRHELQFLADAAARVGNVLVAITKKDAYEEWAEILHVDRERLRGIRSAAVGIVAVSSARKLKAEQPGRDLARRERDLAESGFREVQSWLDTAVIGKVEDNRLLIKLNLCAAVIDRLVELEQAVIGATAIEPQEGGTARREDPRKALVTFKQEKSGHLASGRRDLKYGFADISADVRREIKHSLDGLVERYRSGSRSERVPPGHVREDVATEIQALTLHLENLLHERVSDLVLRVCGALQAAAPPLTGHSLELVDSVVPATSGKATQTLSQDVIQHATYPLFVGVPGSVGGMAAVIAAPGAVMLAPVILAAIPLVGTGAVIWTMIAKGRRLRAEREVDEFLNAVKQDSRHELEHVVAEALRTLQRQAEGAFEAAVEQRQRDLDAAADEQRRAANTGDERTRERQAAEKRNAILEQTRGQVAHLRDEVFRALANWSETRP